MGQCQLKFDATISRKKLDRKIDARNFYLVDRLGSNDFPKKLDGKKVIDQVNSNIEKDFELINTLFSTLGTIAQLAEGNTTLK